MKKITLFCTALLSSTTSFATSNFTGNDGILLIPDVNVNGTTFYDTVTLQLDLNKGTFQVLNAQPKKTTVSDKAIATYTAEGYTIDLFGCASTGTDEITCYSQVVNNKAKRKLAVNGSSYPCNSGLASLLFDDKNNAYKAASVSFATETGTYYTSATIAQGVPANIKLVFKNINLNAKSISSFQPGFCSDENLHFEANFRDIKF